MDSPQSRQIDYRQTIDAWHARVPWHRRISSRLGLQGKILLAFVVLLTISFAASGWVFVAESRAQLAGLMGEQARQLSATLALSSEHSMRTSNWPELKRVGQDLVKSRNILFIGFLDADGNPLVLSSRDLDSRAQDLKLTGQQQTQQLMQVRRQSSPLFGDYLEVLAPVLTNVPEKVAAPKKGADAQPETKGQSRLLGYVAVGVSTYREDLQLTRINFLALGSGCLAGLIAIPLAFVMVRRIFLPIRELVEATKRITRGDLETGVALHRPDVIGDLARSFNEMILWVKKTQQDVESANVLLAEANQDLERKVEQRTAQLETANERLSNEIAEKEDFLRAVSHDLNAPLRNISGMATMLLMKHRGKLDEDVVHRLERIQKNVEVETDLINELLELSRIKTRRQKMEVVEVDRMIWELRGMFENDLRSKVIDLVVDTALPPLNGERPRLRQVFQNLIDNAIKYMGNGPERRIHVGCRMHLTEAEFYVRDTGMGIDPEDLDKVFFVFRRGRSPEAQAVAGKGVGLASVKSIVETYSGKIWVESELGKGTTFRFTINGKYVPSAGGERLDLVEEPAKQTAA